ncbi:FIMAH domain-containing protein [Gracilibacillus sp. D59]|uniref:FIMAH domain-containing protein n=1 Tax=Gracilibacillus sp. D59 TaxID=3457434 RepID=UPI003FCCF465
MLKKILVVSFLVCFIMLLKLPSGFAAEEATATILPFILKNENFAFHERTDALIIDAGKEVDGSTLAISDFDVHVIATRKVDPNYVGYDGPREVIDVYTSDVNDSGYPSDTGRYIIVDFPDVGWGDGGATIEDGYTFDSKYTITYKGEEIAFVDGSSIVPEGFNQNGVVSPVLDKYQYANYEGLDYSYFYNEEAEEPLPLVVFFHGGGQGNDIYTPIRFSNGGTVWANPENQAKYPSHVLAPRNATTPEDMHNVKGIIDEMIAEGKVDPNRVYITGFSMGGGSTWTFLKTFPDFPAAAAPLCPASGPGSVENARAVAYLPIWSFVDEGDFLFDSVVEIDRTYGPYLNDSLLTILPENRLDDPPYNGHVFDGHAVWLPVYNEYVHPERGMLIDWLFSKSKIRGISDVEVNTVSGVAPTIPETVSVDVNYSSTGVVSEERAVVWNEIDPHNYGNDGPGVFQVEGTIQGSVKKVIATVTVEYRNRIADLKETVTGLDIVHGNKNTLMVKLNKAEDFLSDKRHDKSEQAVKQLNTFIQQVNSFVKPGKLTEEQSIEMIEAAKESIRNITNLNNITVS